MGLSSDLISQFVKAAKGEPETKKETTVYGTTVIRDGQTYVKLDGSDLLTPVTSTVTPRENERVTVSIKNHTGTITGNVSAPAARNDDVKELGNVITALDILVANKVSTAALEAERARIDTLVADNVTIRGQLSAAEADIDTLVANDVTINGQLTAVDAIVETLTTTKLDATAADLKYATIDELEATAITVRNLNADFGDFESLTARNFEAVNGTIESLDTKYADIEFANISLATMQKFFANSGVIKDATVQDAAITGHLSGVYISGDYIDAGTVKADKLLLLGNDGLYYKMNTDGTVSEADQNDFNSLNGRIITAKSITASKVSVTDLVAFGATIGGFHITDNSIYSGSKSGVSNTTRGIYLDNDGQIAFGDSSNFLKFYKDSSGKYRLAISAEEFVFSSSGTNVSTAIENAQNAADNAQDAIDNLSVGGRNLLLNSRCVDVFSNNANLYPIAKTTMVEGNRTFIRTRRSSTSSYPTNFSLYNTINPSQLSASLSGEELTFSCLVRGSHATTCRLMHYVQINGVVNNLPTHNTVRNITTEWQRISATVTIPDYSEDATVVFRFTPYTIVIPEGEIDNLYIDTCEWKIEKGNRPTDWTPAPEDVTTDIETAQSTAAKTATNYMKFKSGEGLTIGDMTASTLGRNVLIDSNSVDIRNGSKVLASFEADKIWLGKDSNSAVIDLCSHSGWITASTLSDTDEWWGLSIASQNSININTGIGEFAVDNYYESSSRGSWVSTSIRATAATPWSDLGSDNIYPDYNGVISMESFVNDEATYGANRQYVNIGTATGVVIGQESLPLGIASQTAKIIVKASSAVGENETARIILDAPDTDITGDLIFTTNNERIWGTCTDGTEVEVFQAKNSSNNTVIGWGNYNGNAGDTNLYGNGILVRAKEDISIRADGGNAILRSNGTDAYSKVYGPEVYVQVVNAGTNFRPYFHGIDSFTTQFRGAGYVTSGGKTVYFAIPCAKPIIGAPTVSVTTVNGFVLRQNNLYTHGSTYTNSKYTYAKPTSYSAAVDISKNFVLISATFSDVTNVTNNSPIGIDWSGKITFAYG